MSEDLLGTIVVFGLLAFALAVRKLILHASKRRAEAWGGAARSLGLKFMVGEATGMPTVHGRLGNHGVLATVEMRQVGRDQVSYTVIRVDIGEKLPVGLRLSREGMGAGLLKLMGEEDIQIGDRDLDAGLLIQGARPAEIAGLLRQRGVRDAALRFFEAYPSATLEDAQLTVERRGVLGTELETVLQSCLAMAAALADGARGAAHGAGRGFRPAVGGAGIAVPMPALELHNAIASVARWVVKEGELVHEGALLCEVFTQKGTREVVAPFGGRVVQIVARPGDSVRAGAALLELDPADAPELSADGPAFASDAVVVPEAPQPPSAIEGPVLELYSADVVPVPPEPPVDRAPGGIAVVDEAALLDVDLPEVEPGPDLAGPPAVPVEPPPEEVEAGPRPVASSSDEGPPGQELELEPEPEPPAESLPQAVLSTLAELASGRVGLSKREAAVEAIAPIPVAFTLVVDDVRWTAGLFLASHLQSGRTATGTVEGHDLPLAVAFPAARNAELDAAGRGARIHVRGHVAEWDDLYRRALVHADPET